jgi:hypothetical protein
LVEPHAATASASTGTRANFVMDMSLLTGMWMGWGLGWCDGCG